MLRSDRYNHVHVLNHQLFIAVLGLRSHFFLKRGKPAVMEDLLSILTEYQTIIVCLVVTGNPSISQLMQIKLHPNCINK